MGVLTELCHEIFHSLNTGNCHQIKWSKNTSLFKAPDTLSVFQFWKMTDKHQNGYDT